MELHRRIGSEGREGIVARRENSWSKIKTARLIDNEKKQKRKMKKRSEKKKQDNEENWRNELKGVYDETLLNTENDK
jgi:hypothetical protein